LSDLEKKTGLPCLFCGNTGTEAIVLPDREYHRCLSCQGITLDQRFRLSASAEQERYRLHINTLDDRGYRSYLTHFLDTVLDFYRTRFSPDIKTLRLFDFGSGPTPALVELARERGIDTRFWDPFFAPEGKNFIGGADIVTCLEVAEHFYEPRTNFLHLAGELRPGGLLAIGTLLCDNKDFPSWWYRQDSTHVSFYSKQALLALGREVGLVLESAKDDRIFLFTTKDNPSSP